MQKQNLKKDKNIKKQKIRAQKVKAKEIEKNRENQENRKKEIEKAKRKLEKRRQDYEKNQAKKRKEILKAKRKQEKRREEFERNQEKNRKQILKAQEKKRKQEIKKIQKYQKQRREKELKQNIGNKDIKKIQRRNKIIHRFLALCFFIVAMVLFLLSPVFNIKNVEVFGNNKVSSDTIVSLLQIDNNTNLFKLSYKEIGNRVKQNSYIKSVKVNRILPSGLKITVTEREPSFQLEFGSSFALIDDEGYILEIVKEPMQGIIKIRGYQTSEEMIIAGNRLCDADLERLDDTYKIISVAKNYDLSNLITTVIFEDNNEYSIYIETEKKTVHLGKNEALETKLLYTKEILSRTTGEEGEIFVNMNLNEKNPYFRLKT